MRQQENLLLTVKHKVTVQHGLKKMVNKTLQHNELNVMYLDHFNARTSHS